MTSKAAHHIELQKKLVRKWVQDKTIAVKHVVSKIILADIFTKEMCNGTHFCHLQDSFMSRLSNFSTLCSCTLIMHVSNHNILLLHPLLVLGRCALGRLANLKETRKVKGAC
jgi:hypothetical protein